MPGAPNLHIQISIYPNLPDYTPYISICQTSLYQFMAKGVHYIPNIGVCQILFCTKLPKSFKKFQICGKNI
jgi:hypothetical protein